MKYLISFIFLVFMCGNAFAQATIEEFIFDGSANSPDIPEQGMDMHSFYDGDFIWYAYHDYTDQAADSNRLLRYSPEIGELKIIQLADSTTTGENVPKVYQAIQGLDSDTIFIYSTYGTRAIWEYSKTTGVSTYTELGFEGAAGGKIATAIIGIEETLLCTSTTRGYPVLFQADGLKTTELTTFGAGSYGVQTDGVNFFMLDLVNNKLNAITFNAAHTPTVTAFISTIGTVDIAWDGEFIWGQSRIPGETNLIEQFRPIYTGSTVTSFELIAVHYTGSDYHSICASIKANDTYVVAAWEGAIDGTIGWSILTRATGKWTQFRNAALSTTVPASVYPFTGQYWTTVTVEIDVPGEIYITGYSPENAAIYMQPGSCPEHSMRMLKLTMNGSILSDGTLSGGIIY